ncbi:probable DNA-directed RNA polymerases I and III subunit RPAC2 isoform X2 [Bacillus rossius redtenbacheri]|uniref:probable DNA-directed RNA polymerases I and III subunit RPAC2 isoform X2 n=1 Tax=Bacillus rossius redtenbacheri TaxID=93214 RepID=UPI002FDC9038
MNLIAELAGDELSEKSRTFVFSEGGHTFGNALRSIISRYPEVLLCGYTVPHPSQADMHFRIQTAGPRAIDVLRRGIEDLEKLCDHTLTTFQVEMEAYQQYLFDEC